MKKPDIGYLAFRLAEYPAGRKSVKISIRCIFANKGNKMCLLLEPYTPSPDEVGNPKLFAENVRKVGENTGTSITYNTKASLWIRVRIHFPS